MNTITATDRWQHVGNWLAFYKASLTAYAAGVAQRDINGFPGPDSDTVAECAANLADAALATLLTRVPQAIPPAPESGEGLARDALVLCHTIETLPASPEQTRVRDLAAKLHQAICDRF